MRSPADIVSRQIRNKPDSVLGLATGSHPPSVICCWPISIRRGELDFSRVKTFNLDSIGAFQRPSSELLSLHVRKSLFSKINIKDENVNLLNGEGLDPTSMRRFRRKDQGCRRD